MSDSEKQINFRGTLEYRQKLQQAALDRGLKVQGLLERAIEAYLKLTDHDKGPTAQPKELHVTRKGKLMELPISKLHERWYADLSEILMRGNPDEQATLRRLIEHFVKQIRERERTAGPESAPHSGGSTEGHDPHAGQGDERRKR